jgi:hypothetical protein
MNNRNIILLSVSILCVCLLVESVSAAVDFPAEEAGISAYVKAKESINLDDAKSAFASIERETPDYIIGTVALAQHTEEQYPHLYVSTDGWIVAYYPNDKKSSWILPWADYAGGPLSSTYLSKAVGKVATAVGGTANDLKYYDFRYPDASKMMIILESKASGNNDFYVTIPTTFTVYVVDWSHYNIDQGYYDYSHMYLNGISKSTIDGYTGAKYGSFLGEFGNGIEHRLTIAVASEATGRIGLVLEYAE